MIVKKCVVEVGTDLSYNNVKTNVIGNMLPEIQSIFFIFLNSNGI